MTLGVLLVSHAPGNEQIIIIKKGGKSPASKESNISPPALVQLGCSVCLSGEINGTGPGT